MTTPDQTRVRHRRGMLLLLVLSVLTLFVMVGAVSLVLATRARTAARAFAAASTAAVREEVRARAALDEALMQLLRGSAPGMAVSPVSESMLADRYGTSGTGSLSNLTVINSGSTLRATLVGVSAPKPMALNGRVLTIRPPAGDPAPISSFRITDFTSGTVFLANLRTVAPFRPLPTQFPCTAIINGRDFDGTAGNEPYDRPNDANAFLTSLEGGPAFQPSVPGQVDNDGDGTAEGTWLSGVLQPQVRTDGGSVSFQVSYTVYELDGRLNVNAHGTPSGAPSLTGTVGPADIDGTAAFPGGGWTRLMATGSIRVPDPSPPSARQRRPTPVIGHHVNNRFGNITSGVGPYDDTMRLDFDGRRLGAPSLTAETTFAGGTSASIFTPAELERLLRPFDADASALPPRLAAILGDDAQASRMLVTTDSWDTTGLTGAAARSIVGCTATNELPPDVVQGRRFDINSGSVATDAAKQAYFHQLLAVVLAAGAPSGTAAAQWVANVIDFRDVDTTLMTGTTKTNYAGVSVTPAVIVSGTEAELAHGSAGGNLGQFTSTGQLLCVPQGSPKKLADPTLDPEEKKTLLRSLAVDYPVILDAVTVASPFTLTVNANPWREPGRVNVNTSGTAVWQAVLGEGAGNPYTAAQTAGAILTDGFIFSDAEKPYTAVRTGRANRLANIATTRSNVFAVWVTVKITDSDPAVPETYRRLFAIVDRSIPVGYQPGVNLNARDTLRLVRYLE